MSETPAPDTTRGMLLAAEAAASSRLDGETIVIGGPITVGERITLAATGGDTAPDTTAATPVAPIMRGEDPQKTLCQDRGDEIEHGRTLCCQDDPMCPWPDYCYGCGEDWLRRRLAVFGSERIMTDPIMRGHA